MLTLEYPQIFPSKQRNQTIAFTITQDSDPKHLLVSSCIRLGKVKLWNWDECTRVYSFASLGATYRRATGSKQKVSASLVGQGGQFTVRTRNKDHLMANPSVGFTANPGTDISTTLSYEGKIGSNQRNHQALVRINWSF